jgi:hypothetical protein
MAVYKEINVQCNRIEVHHHSRECKVDEKEIVGGVMTIEIIEIIVIILGKMTVERPYMVVGKVILLLMTKLGGHQNVSDLQLEGALQVVIRKEHDESHHRVVATDEEDEQFK